MKCGVVSIMGRPNVGKSTLLNAILNMKLAITTDKAGTTRNIIEGIYQDDEAQIVFIDTPGIHKPMNKLGSVLNKKAYQNIDNADIILLLIDVNSGIGKGDRFVLNKIKTRYIFIPRFNFRFFIFNIILLTTIIIALIIEIALATIISFVPVYLTFIFTFCSCNAGLIFICTNPLSDSVHSISLPFAYTLYPK